MSALLGGLLFLVAVGASMLGQGGGVLDTPIQVWLGIRFHTAATTSLFLIMVISLSSSLVFRKAGKIDWPLAIVLELATSLGGFSGGLGSSQFSGATLSLIFAAVVALAALFMIRTIERRPPCPNTGARLLIWKRRLDARIYCVNLGVALPTSFIVGLVSGLVGVAGGILKVPMMVLLFGVPTDIAIRSSALMIGLTAAGGFGGHVAAGHWDWKTSLILAILVFAGGQIGSRISVRLNKKRMKKIFGWFLLCIAAMMAITSGI